MRVGTDGGDAVRLNHYRSDSITLSSVLGRAVATQPRSVDVILEKMYTQCRGDVENEQALRLQERTRHFT